MAIEFKKSKDYTLGIEVEVQLIDIHTYALTSTSSKIIERINNPEGSIKHELMMSNLEINTKICTSIKEAESDLNEKFKILFKHAIPLDTILCCAGTHPFSLWKEQTITENVRYKHLLARLQLVARRFNIFGLHVHTGIGGGEKCIYIMNKMLFYLPHLLAISANSPFWEGEDTGLRSYRTKVFENLPIAGLPFYFEDWKDYTHLIEGYKATGTIESIREIWWDIRPHPDFGTLEVRICDVPSTIKEMVSIAALIQALVKRFGDEYEDGLPFKRPHSAVIRENKWRACRYGLEGNFITMDGYRTIKISDGIEEMLDSLKDVAKDLNSVEYMDHIRDVLRYGNGAVRQLKVWKRYRDLKEVVKVTSDRLLRELEMPLK